MNVVLHPMPVNFQVHWGKREVRRGKFQVFIAGVGGGVGWGLKACLYRLKIVIGVYAWKS